jgi:hypothetical protein
MKKDLPKIEILLRDSSDPFRRHGPCLIRLQAFSDSRVVEMNSNAIRVAFVASEIRILADAMKRAYPRLTMDTHMPLCDPNHGYVPGKVDVPFLVACSALDGTVKIGIELVETVRHPVVELCWKPGSSVRRKASTVDWMPTWTQFRTLYAEFSAHLQKLTGITQSKAARIMSVKAT